jgi:hypothetical protein
MGLNMGFNVEFKGDFHGISWDFVGFTLWLFI